MVAITTFAKITGWLCYLAVGMSLLERHPSERGLALRLKHENQQAHVRNMHLLIGPSHCCLEVGATVGYILQMRKPRLREVQ